jgi:hypothetical protein
MRWWCRQHSATQLVRLVGPPSPQFHPPPGSADRHAAIPSTRHRICSGSANSNDLLLTYSDFGISTVPDSPVAGTVVTGTEDSTLSNSSMRCW